MQRQVKGSKIIYNENIKQIKSYLNVKKLNLTYTCIQHLILSKNLRGTNNLKSYSFLKRKLGIQNCINRQKKIQKTKNKRRQKGRSG